MTDETARPSARRLLGSEMRRMRQAIGMSQEQLAAQVLHSRALITLVELGERWAPDNLVARCDDVLRADGALYRLWPLVEQERLSAQRILTGARLSEVHDAVLRLAALTSTDLSVLRVRDADEPDDPPPAATRPSA